MFTGIVQEIGIISNKEETESGVRLKLKFLKLFLINWKRELVFLSMVFV